MKKIITSKQLCEITGLTRQRHLQLAKEKYFPKPDHGKYSFVPTLKGLLRYYRELADKKSNVMQGAAEKKLMGQANIWDIKAKQAAGELVPAKDLSAGLGELLTKFRLRLENLGDSVAAICHQQDSEFIAQRINDAYRSAFGELAAMPFISAEVKKKAMHGPLPKASSSVVSHRRAG